jgi:hypothetical protein
LGIKQADIKTKFSTSLFQKQSKLVNVNEVNLMPIKQQQEQQKSSKTSTTQFKYKDLRMNRRPSIQTLPQLITKIQPNSDQSQLENVDQSKSVEHSPKSDVFVSSERSSRSRSSSRSSSSAKSRSGSQVSSSKSRSRSRSNSKEKEELNSDETEKSLVSVSQQEHVPSVELVNLEQANIGAPIDPNMNQFMPNMMMNQPNYYYNQQQQQQFVGMMMNHPQSGMIDPMFQHQQNPVNMQFMNNAPQYLQNQRLIYV